MAVKISLKFSPLLEGMLDLVYPRNCVSCGNPVGKGKFYYICEACENQLYLVNPPCCLTCGYPFYGAVESVRRCPHCVDLTPVFEQGRTILLHRGLGRTLIQELKYGKAFYLLKDILHIIRAAPGLLAYLHDAVLVPVPLHKRKLRERGFNQSQILAKCFATGDGGLPVVEVLERIIDTPSQTRFNREQRQHNVKNAFALSKNIVLNRDKYYIIVDDVFTTGATLNACSKVLRQAGIRRLNVLTLGHG